MIQLCEPTIEDVIAMGFYYEEDYTHMVVVDNHLVYWFTYLSELEKAIAKAYDQGHPIVISPESIILEVSSLEELKTLYPEYLI